MSEKRHEGSLYGNKKKKRVKGVVDRVTAGIVVVVIRHPDATSDEPDTFLEIYVPIEKFVSVHVVAVPHDQIFA